MNKSRFRGISSLLNVEIKDERKRKRDLLQSGARMAQSRK